jgi:hypothetical protein
MEYIIDMRLGEKTKRTYRINAKDEEEAKERLKLRLAPQHREEVIIDSIRLYQTTLGDDDPYGIFGDE